jgi:hypothetical protein
VNLKHAFIRLVVLSLLLQAAVHVRAQQPASTDEQGLGNFFLQTRPKAWTISTSTLLVKSGRMGPMCSSSTRVERK